MALDKTNRSRIIDPKKGALDLGLAMRTRYVPRLDFVLLKALGEATAVSAGGIVIPDMAKAQSNVAKVIEVGPGRRLPSGELLDTGLESGDIVIHGKYTVEELTLDDEPYLLCRADDVKLVERKVLS